MLTERSKAMLDDNIKYLNRFLGLPSHTLNNILTSQLTIFKPKGTVHEYSDKNAFRNYQSSLLEDTTAFNNDRVYQRQYGFIIKEQDLTNAFNYITKNAHLSIKIKPATCPTFDTFERISRGIAHYFKTLNLAVFYYLIEHRQIWLYLTYKIDEPKTYLFNDFSFSNDLFREYIAKTKYNSVYQTIHNYANNFIITNQYFSQLPQNLKQQMQKWLIPKNAFTIKHKNNKLTSEDKMNLEELLSLNDLAGLNSLIAPYVLKFYEENGIKYVDFTLPKIQEQLQKYNPDERKVITNQLFKEMFNCQLTNNFIKDYAHWKNKIHERPIPKITNNETIVLNHNHSILNQPNKPLKQSHFTQVLMYLSKPVTKAKYDTTIHYDYQKLAADFQAKHMDANKINFSHRRTAFYQNYDCYNRTEIFLAHLNNAPDFKLALKKQLKNHYFAAFQFYNFEIDLPVNNFTDINNNLTKHHRIEQDNCKYHSYLLISTLDQKDLKQIIQIYLKQATIYNQQTTIYNQRKNVPIFNYQIEQTKIGNYQLLLANPIVDYQELLGIGNCNINPFYEYHFNCRQSQSTLNLKNLPCDLTKVKSFKSDYLKHDAFTNYIEFGYALINNTIPLILQQYTIHVKSHKDWFKNNNELLKNKNSKFLDKLASI